MNKYKNLSEEEMLGVCNIINTNASWSFHQLLDNDGNGTDDCYEFLSDQEDIVQFDIHQSSDDEIRCYSGCVMLQNSKPGGNVIDQQCSCSSSVITPRHTAEPLLKIQVFTKSEEFHLASSVPNL